MGKGGEDLLRVFSLAGAGVELEEILEGGLLVAGFAGEGVDFGGGEEPPGGAGFPGAVEKVGPEELVDGLVVEFVPAGADFVVFLPLGVFLLEGLEFLELGGGQEVAHVDEQGGFLGFPGEGFGLGSRGAQIAEADEGADPALPGVGAVAIGPGLLADAVEDAEGALPVEFAFAREELVGEVETVARGAGAGATDLPELVVPAFLEKADRSTGGIGQGFLFPGREAPDDVVDPLHGNGLLARGRTGKGDDVVGNGF